MIVFIITFYRWHISGFQVQDKTNASLFSVTTETTRDVKLIHRKGRINIHLRTGYSYLEIHHFCSAHIHRDKLHGYIIFRLRVKVADPHL